MSEEELSGVPASRPPARSAIVGVGLTPYSRNSGSGALELQAVAAFAALDDAGLGAQDVDTMIVGYATTMNHLMPANLLAEHLGARPERAFGMSVGGATGLAMVAEAARLVSAGEADTVLVVGGENRASGQTRNASIATLAQVGHATHEVPIGANVPAYYALLASEYLHRHGLDRSDLAPLAVQMRANAARHPGAHFRAPIGVADVLAAPLIAAPLGLLDCCPVSDGAAAFVVRAAAGPRGTPITGIGQTNPHQHVSEIDVVDVGARGSGAAALAQAGLAIEDIEVFGIYDSFTVTLAILLEELGVAAPGQAGRMAADGAFAIDGPKPLNPHGGLLSFGHPGVSGGMAHLAELVVQLRGEAGAERQVPGAPRHGLVHADGGVLSAHITLVLDTSRRQQ